MRGVLVGFWVTGVAGVHICVCSLYFKKNVALHLFVFAFEFAFEWHFCFWFWFIVIVF